MVFINAANARIETMANDDNQEANEDVLEAVEDLEACVNDLKEAAEDHPDESVKTALNAELAKCEAIITNLRAAVGGR
jgi:hypothetical protein